MLIRIPASLSQTGFGKGKHLIGAGVCLRVSRKEQCFGIFLTATVRWEYTYIKIA